MHPNPQVYNLTPFLHYHPGGVAEILKGAGRDCTALFDKYHPWVNFDTLVGVSGDGSYGEGGEGVRGGGAGVIAVRVTPRINTRMSRRRPCAD